MRFSIHILDGSNGGHAGDVPVDVHSVDADGKRVLRTQCVTDAGGRAAAQIPRTEGIDVVIASGARFQTADAPVSVEAVTLRIAVRDGAEGVHLPTVIAPNSSSLCWLKSGT
ncbi:hydroxyisourate hydrolase [Sedimentitalea sp. JM2-8]|uniref:Hydroxyisourate hydrolase n=1 Tax=Sedimentitalea xiamensis TaxID=3050037 RepID=A0ABT7FFQ2_9RHOB|nr:hydroxyisourate hydrolase [Sedimentitalea xiamensis]MDK3073903.1 hydroxyisourate hydrolase [Sedimentitalea xiamensis]